jgi:hypothetical protein
MKIYFWTILLVITFLVFFLRYKSRDAGKVVKCAEMDGFVSFYDADSGNIRRTILCPASTTVFKNTDGNKYLLQYESSNHSASIYDINGSKLKEVLLAGRQIETSNSKYVIIQKKPSEQKDWDMLYDCGLVLNKTQQRVPANPAENTHTTRIIMWGNSALAIFDKNENRIYQETFFGRNFNIEKVLPCAGSKVIVFCSEDEYPENFGPDWEYYKTNRRISFSIIDYEQNSNDLQPDVGNNNLHTIDDLNVSFEDIKWPIYCGTRLLSVEEFFMFDAVCSRDGIYIAGTINDSTVFLINVESENVIFRGPLNRVIRENTHDKILQVGVSCRGIVHILRYYTSNNKILAYENYGRIGDVKHICLVEDMGDTAKMSIDKDEVVITDNGREKTIKLF